MDVSAYIPHRPPMQLIETIDSFTDMQVRTITHITPEAGFYDAEAGGVPAWVGLEYMAQTAAVWIGLDDESHGRAIEPAFLVSSRHFAAHMPVFSNGERLIIEVNVQLMESDVVAFNGNICGRDGTLYAEALFTAYRPENVWDYLRGDAPQNRA